jgi:hypothetical protein
LSWDGCTVGCEGAIFARTGKEAKGRWMMTEKKAQDDNRQTRDVRFGVSAHRGEARIRYSYVEGNRPSTGCRICDLEQSGALTEAGKATEEDSAD